VNRTGLVAKTLFCVIETFFQLRSEEWQRVTSRLEVEHKFSRALNVRERQIVFNWSRRFCRLFQFSNGCLISSLVLLKLDSSPAQFFVGLNTSKEAHAWVRSEDLIYTTDRQLPKDASLVFEKSSPIKT
jgi:hypothetical protein